MSTKPQPCCATPRPTPGWSASLALAAALILGSCKSAPPDGACAPRPEEPAAPPPGDDVLTPTRLLRRAALALRGTPPTDAEYAALLAAGDAAAQQRHVDAFVDRTLTDPAFYRSMFELGRAWLNVPLVANDADAPEYGPQQQRSVRLCPPGSARAGALHYNREGNDPCDGLDGAGQAVLSATIEPWWDPGHQVTLVGDAANQSGRGVTNINGNPVAIECQGRPEGTCGCGEHAVRCHPDLLTYPGWPDFVPWNERGQRRLLSEEPARLFAHLAWHDRPVTDLVLGSYSVGSTHLQAAYVMQGIEGGALQLLSDDSWWRPARWAGAPADPEHDAADPFAWREFQVPARNPFLLAERDYRFDPRTDAGPMRGIPAAGILTSPGFLDALPRERLRAARALEHLACEVLSPPSGLHFNEYQRDPYSEGPCQHCHRRIDPAALHFKRWGKAGAAFEGWGASYLMPGIGARWHWPKSWRSGAYPYGGDPFRHWNRWYVADTGLTPVTQAQIDVNPEVVFIDFLPPDMTLLGQKGDGTVGPLGFAKLIVAAGAFDRCVVRQLHGQVLGRDLDPAAEAGYLDALTAAFVQGGRKVRPLVKLLTRSELFRRGI